MVGRCPCLLFPVVVRPTQKVRIILSGFGEVVGIRTAVIICRHRTFIFDLRQFQVNFVRQFLHFPREFLVFILPQFMKVIIQLLHFFRFVLCGF